MRALKLSSSEIEICSRCGSSDFELVEVYNDQHVVAIELDDTGDTVYKVDKVPYLDFVIYCNSCGTYTEATDYESTEEWMCGECRTRYDNPSEARSCCS